ncbi:MAG: glucose-1-phosphate adenylyltransferase [Gemmataceae bacterium]
MSRSVLSLILGGGRGARLFPLTKSRSKPAMPVAGRYRLIDIPISNCINSGFNRIYVLTQFLSVSLHTHIGNTYKFDMFDRGFVEILAAQQTNETADWYQGTADAIRQNLGYIRDHYDDVLILSGDQLYRMNYKDLLTTHRDRDADVTIAMLPVARDAVEGLGIVRVKPDGRVDGFVEKPKTDAEAAPCKLPAGLLQHFGIDANGREYLANMGIYVFKRDFLMNMLTTPTASGKLPTDFGKDIFPNVYKTHNVQAHVFDGFWEDLGTIKSYHQVNLDLTDDNPPFEFHHKDGIIYTRVRNLPPCLISSATLDRVRLAEGCVIQAGAVIMRSVVGVRCRIGKNTQITESVLIGADSLESDERRAQNARQGAVDLGIGDGAVITGAIVDKDCRIGRNVVIDNASNIQNEDHALYHIRDGIVVIPRGMTIPHGTHIPAR